MVYGDSLTWGYDPAGPGRHAFHIRWPSVLEATLGAGVRVIAEGLNGRTTAYDDHTADCDRNGARLLPTLLHSHAPLDLVILMLGTNDLKAHMAGTAIAAQQGMRRLVQLIQHHAWQFDHDTPPVLIVAPPRIVETADPDFSAAYAGAVSQSAMLASLYADLADEVGAGFFDAGSVAQSSAADGIHLDADNTIAIGRGLAPMAQLMIGG
nr:SGNH/GDSL hydrolase family protein [Pseudohoeflea sp. DP4N28-3]